MATGLTDADRWQLRAEEYRAIAATMSDIGSQAVMLRLAETYDRLAASGVSRRMTREQCEARAQECAEYTKRFQRAASKQAILGIAERWRELGQRRNNA